MKNTIRAAFALGHNSVMTEWRQLRNGLTAQMTDLDHLIQVADFWSCAPLQTRLLDWDNPETWLDAWQLVSLNRYDESSVALGMFYSLLYSSDGRWKASRMNIILATDEDTSVQQLMLLVDDQWLLNCEYASVLNVNDRKNNLRIQEKYCYNGRAFEIVPNSIINMWLEDSTAQLG